MATPWGGHTISSRLRIFPAERGSLSGWCFVSGNESHNSVLIAGPKFNYLNSYPMPWVFLSVRSMASSGESIQSDSPIPKPENAGLRPRAERLMSIIINISMIWWCSSSSFARAETVPRIPSQQYRLGAPSSSL